MTCLVVPDNQLVEEHMGLAHVLALDYINIPGITVSDAVSEANAALFRAWQAYDPRKGEFTPFAARVIRNALNTLYAKQLRLARLFPKSLDDPPSRPAASAETDAGPLALPDSKQDVRKAVKRQETNTVLREVLRTLTPREQLVVEYMRQGHSLSEIGEKLGVSKQAVHKVSAPALDKVKSALEATGYSGLDSQGFLKSASSQGREALG